MPTKVIKKVTKKQVVKATKVNPVHTAHAVKSNALEIPVFDTDGKAAGTMKLPAEIFGVKVNKELIAQAVRVYLANQRTGNAETKTRGQVEGSTRKIYRQKGTGRARHGGIRAPIFVGGGVVFGPHRRDYSLSMPQKMKKLALYSALTDRLNGDKIIVINGLEKVEPKTKIMANLLNAVHADKSVLLVLTKDEPKISQMAGNIQNLDILPFSQIYTYAIMSHDKIVFTKNSLEKLCKV